MKDFPKDHVIPYEHIRPHIQSGDLLMCSGSGWFSKMIRKATGSCWSHVGFVMRLDQIDRIMVLESLEPAGVRTVPLSSGYMRNYCNSGAAYPGGVVIARHPGMEAALKSPEALKSFGQGSVDLFGYPYDKAQIAKIAARITASYLPWNDDELRDLEHDDEYICSEYVYERWASVGVKIDHDPRGFTAPADFAEHVELVAVLKR